MLIGLCSAFIYDTAQSSSSNSVLNNTPDVVVSVSAVGCGERVPLGPGAPTSVTTKNRNDPADFPDGTLSFLAGFASLGGLGVSGDKNGRRLDEPT